MSDFDYIDDMNAYYEARAGLHDTFMSFVSNEQMEKLLGALIRLFEKDIKDRNILEIACGTGNWTTVLAKRAKQVTATDSSESMLKIACEKLSDYDNVKFVSSDAYQLDNITGKFDCAFASDWWSHMPRKMVGPFLSGLHSKLAAGAKVIFIDTLPIPDQADVLAESIVSGDTIQKRILPDGRVFKIVKNLPSKADLSDILSGIAVDIRYYVHTNLQRWVLVYTKSSRA
jgi:cyclopropane fatty-acyl-phospholipid synthase-like methyltransferase